MLMIMGNSVYPYEPLAKRPPSVRLLRSDFAHDKYEEAVCGRYSPSVYALPMVATRDRCSRRGRLARLRRVVPGLRKMVL